MNELVKAQTDFAQEQADNDRAYREGREMHSEKYLVLVALTINLIKGESTEG